MKTTARHLLPGFVVLPLGAFAMAGVLSAPPAAADCTNSGGVSVCAQGTVRGPNDGSGPGTTTGPYTPYPCDYDYLCDAGLSIELGPPDWDRPDRPWRPGGGGGGIGPRN